ncbi:MAG: adenylyl-sulfate kinase, partial [Thermoanaerobacterales bacterium]|nr:adenylyl-sulfate kinase [Thermoanaerobacterales bacterium]
MSHQGLTIWLTGHSGAGKSTLARRVALELKNRGCRVEVLDGDIIRKVFSPTLGYTKLDRMENIRRIAFLANILSKNGIIV